MRQLSFIITDFDLWFKIFIVTAPFVWASGMIQNSLQFLMFDYGSLLLFGVAMLNPQVRECKNPVPLLIALFTIIIGVSNNPMGYPVALITVTSGVILYYAMVTRLKDVKGVIKLLLFMAAINVVVSLIQKYGFYFIYEKTVGNMTLYDYHLSMPGFMGRNYHLSYMLIFLAPLGFLFSPVIGVVGLLIAGAFAVLLKSYTCMLAFILMVAFLSTKYIKKNYIITFLLIAFSLTLFFHHKKLMVKLAPRLESYQFLVKQVTVNIFKGFGVGTFDRNVDLYAEDNTIESSFNQYLRSMYEFGLLPFIAMVIVCFNYFKRFPYHNRFMLASIIGILIYPMLHEVCRFARLDILILTIFAIFEIDCIETQSLINNEKRSNYENHSQIQREEIPSCC